MRASIRIFLSILLSITFINCELFEFLTGDLNENDNCVLSENVNGTCLKISNCSHEHEKYRRRETTLKICQLSESDNDAFICCPPKIKLESRFTYGDDEEPKYVRPPPKKYNHNFFNIKVCSNRHLSLRQKNNWSAMAAIGWTQSNGSVKFTCGGVIISEWFIITAASCRGTNTRKFPDIVRVGSSTQDDSHSQQLTIEKFIHHPYYRNNKIYQDIAVVKTKTKITFNEFVIPACVGDVDNKFSQLKTADYEQVTGDTTFILHEADVRIYQQSTCNLTYARNPKTPRGITSSEICTLAKKNSNRLNANACQRDAGYPIQYIYNYQINKNDSVIYEIPAVVGFVSSEIKCGVYEVLSISPRISNYRKWILTVMNKFDSTPIEVPIEAPSERPLHDGITTTPRSRKTTTEFTPITNSPLNINKTILFEDDYFVFNICRERNLKYRKVGSKIDRNPRKTKSESRLSEEDCNEIHENRDDGTNDCVNGIIDPFYQITSRIDDGDDSFFHMINGRITSEGDWAFIAAIGYTQIDERVEFSCGGVIISDRFIITAAHCRIREKIKPDTVRVGDRYLTSIQDDDHAQQLGIEKFFFHPKYRFNLGYNDIAMIKTDDKIIFNNYVMSACLDDVTDERMVMKIAGFGKTSSTGDKPSGILYEISADIYSTEKCNHSFDGYPKVPDGIKSSQICLKGKKLPNGQSSDSCQGDSGGPIQHTYNYEVQNHNYAKTRMMTVYKIPIVVGIVSFGVECGMDVPSVNTRIFFFREWILCMMNEMMADTSTENLKTCVKNLQN